MSSNARSSISSSSFRGKNQPYSKTSTPKVINNKNIAGDYIANAVQNNNNTNKSTISNILPSSTLSNSSDKSNRIDNKEMQYSNDLILVIETIKLLISIKKKSILESLPYLSEFDANSSEITRNCFEDILKCKKLIEDMDKKEQDYFSKQETQPNRGRMNNRDERSAVKRHSSVGLPNKGNTCYVNSALQMIAHLPNDLIFRNSTTIKNNLKDLIRSMRQSDTINLDRKLSTFLDSLHRDSDFERHRQSDPKYLIIYLLKDSDLICSIRNISFRHNNHSEEYPEQKVNVFQIDESYNLSLKNLFINTINKTFLECSSDLVEGYCSTCQFNCRGREEITRVQLAKVLILSLTSQIRCSSIKEIENITFGYDNYELFTIIQRYGSSRSSGHIFAVCKEPTGWIQYNDSQKVNYSRDSIDDCYIFAYVALNR